MDYYFGWRNPGKNGCKEGFGISNASEIEDYVFPQENGSHTDCDYLILKGKENTFAAAGERTFSFNVSPYTQEELTAKRHSYELQPCGSTVVCLDYVQNGIGSNSCGPELSEQYRLDAEQFNFEIKMIIK